MTGSYARTAVTVERLIATAGQILRYRPDLGDAGTGIVAEVIATAAGMTTVAEAIAVEDAIRAAFTDTPGQPAPETVLAAALREASPEQVQTALTAAWGRQRRARLAGLLTGDPAARLRTPAGPGRKPGALLAGITRLLATRGEWCGLGLSIAELARDLDWSASAIRREIGLMDNLGLVWYSRPGRTQLWHLTKPALKEWAKQHGKET